MPLSRLVSGVTHLRSFVDAPSWDIQLDLARYLALNDSSARANAAPHRPAIQAQKG